MLRPYQLLALLMLTAAWSLPAAAQDQAPDYASLDAWLCHPDNDTDACDRDLTTTVIAPDGSFTQEEWPDNGNPAIDCFYAYPTTSLDETGNSDLEPGEQGEIITAHLQTARLRSQCRVFGPIYRQVTIPALRSMMMGEPKGDRAMAYNDVLDAWNHYLEHENDGRGVVLVGHSQGAGILARLIASEIDGKPVQDRLVSAVLTGTSVTVPEGETVGGTFEHIPLCTSADQIGCVITFASFRDRIPPPANSLFGRADGEGIAGCTNPAALGGGRAELDHYLSTIGEISASFGSYEPWTQPPREVETPFVKLPGLLSGECVQRDGFSYLEVSVNADPNDARADDIVGDLVTGGEINASWGLHLIDMSLVMGDLESVVAQQAQAYRQRAGSE